MPHIADRFVHDADAHTMETRDWLAPFCEDKFKEQIASLFNRSFDRQGENYQKTIDLHDEPAFRAKDEEEFMARKNLMAIGSFRKEDRAQAIDLLGVQSQLLFPTSANVHLESLEHGEDMNLLYAMARASNRAQIDFCNVDERLFPVCNVPLADMKEALSIAQEAIKLGARALLIPWACPKNHATSHIGLDPVQQGMNPIEGFNALHLLDDAMGFVPLGPHAEFALPDPPECLQWHAEVLGRRGPIQ